MKRKPYVLMILDGWGIGKQNSYNAVYSASTPSLDKLMEYPRAELDCSGLSVGLPKGIMGNSEVGHLNIGAGRVVYQDLLRIDKSIEDGSFYKKPVLHTAFDKVLSSGSSLHFIGLVSDGGVHSQIAHLYALLDLAKNKNIDRLFVHAIMDGRDTPPDKGIEYIEQLQSYLTDLGNGSIGSICGRYYAMDRDKRWDRIEKAYKLYTEGVGRIETNPIEAVNKAYLRGETDEFIQPIVITNNNSIESSIHDNDAVVFFNFRADRVREICSALTESEFEYFDRKLFPKLSECLSMTMYDRKFNFPNIFPPIKIENILGKVISNNNLNQLRIAETEKYAHVTYFFNGGEEEAFDNEDRCLIPSPRDVDTYDEKPEMSAWELTEEVVKQIKSGKYNFIVINFANMDMVGHTGSLDAAIKACETVDKCVREVVNTVMSEDGIIIITADHGNSEKMLDDTGKPFTAHTKNKVPFLVVGGGLRDRTINNTGSLRDIAPTILDLMGIIKPKDMTGRSLFEQ